MAQFGTGWEKVPNIQAYNVDSCTAVWRLETAPQHAEKLEADCDHSAIMF